MSTQWKADNRDLIVETTRVLYRDENVRLRKKNDEKATEVFTPVISRIVAEGVERGELHTPHPEDAGEIIFLLSRGMGGVIAELFLKAVEDSSYIDTLAHKLEVYERATERIIGAPEGAITLTDLASLRRLVTGADGTGEEAVLEPREEQEEHR